MGTNGQQKRETSPQRGVEAVGEAGRRSMMSRPLAVAAGVCVSLAAASGRAETPAPQETQPPAAATEASPLPPEPLAAALARLRPGQRIRIAADGRNKVEGRLLAVGEGGRVVLGPSELNDRLSSGVPIESVRSVWVRGRATKRGAIAGGVIGGLAGGLFGTFAALMNDSANRTLWSTGTALGLAAGGTVGGITGGIVGTATPHWHRVYSSGASRGGPLSLSFAPGEGGLTSERIGSVSLQLGYDKPLGTRSASGSLGGRLALAAELGEVNPGLEIGRYALGSSDVLTWQGAGHIEESLVHLGPVVSVGSSHGTVRPYAIAGVGYYRWTTLDPGVLEPLCEGCEGTTLRKFIGGSVGAGVRVRSTRGLSFGLEGRWHTQLSNVLPRGVGAHDRGRLNLLSISAGATIGW
jgi:hypothetical protein